MKRYSHQHRFLVAVDSIIFGFDGKELKILLIRRGFEPEKGKWSLMGGFVGEKESPGMAAIRILKELTGLDNVYMEQLHSFGEPHRDPVERTVSVAYFALIDIHQYEAKLSDHYHPGWFPLRKIPRLIFDHAGMVSMAQQSLRQKAAAHPILFELLPERFTLPALQNLYECVYERTFDKRNFSRKILAGGWLVKTSKKEKNSSKKGAYYYKLNKRRLRMGLDFDTQF